ncbi:MAG TPA: c-type cytochrome [Gammaproteobacteria bacterium]|nr:c-type cytochrome [Gammaproteobacteria bacterium]
MKSAPRTSMAIRLTARVASCVTALLCAACAGPQDYMHGASPGARDIASFGWWVLICFCAAAAVVWVVLAYIALRRDGGSFAVHAPAEEEKGRPWILIGGLGVPAAVFLAFFGLMFSPMKASPTHRHADKPADIRIIGRQWWFEAEYRGERPDLAVRVPTELHIPVGKPVDVELESRDVIHSFWIPKLQGKVDLVPGRVNRVRLMADAPGVYRGECAEFCGVQHAHMRVEIVAETPARFEAWLDAQRAPAKTPSYEDELAARGRDVFQSAACALCHTIRGTPARGLVGPDLTHLGSRAHIAGGSFDNNTANLAAWIADAQSMKPGAQMPSLRQLSGADLRALVSYLQSLR